MASWLDSWILKFQMFKESGKKQPKIPAGYEFLPAMTHTPAGEQSKSLLNLHIEITYFCLSFVLTGVHF